MSWRTENDMEIFGRIVMLSIWLACFLTSPQLLIFTHLWRYINTSFSTTSINSRYIALCSYLEDYPPFIYQLQIRLDRESLDRLSVPRIDASLQTECPLLSSSFHFEYCMAIEWLVNCYVAFMWDLVQPFVSMVFYGGRHWGQWFQNSFNSTRLIISRHHLSPILTAEKSYSVFSTRPLLCLDTRALLKFRSQHPTRASSIWLLSIPTPHCLLAGWSHWFICRDEIWRGYIEDTTSTFDRG